MLHIYCPYCGTPYDIDESLMPEDNVRVRCRSCVNVFVINKENGAIKDEPGEREYTSGTISVSENNLSTGELKAKKEPEDKTHKKTDENNNGAGDFMKSIMQEIDGPFRKETGKEERRKTGILRIIILLLLIILLVIAGVYTLDYYKIINLPLIFPKPFQ